MKFNISISRPVPYIILFLSIVFMSCQSSNKQSKPIPDMKFNVERSLLGEEVNDAEEGITYCPPVDWAPVTGKELKTASAAISKALENQKEVKVIPLNIFVNKNTSSILNIAEIKITGTGNDFDTKMDLYQKFFMHNMDSSKVQKAVYKKGDIIITQFLIRGSNMVNFRLLFENGKKNIIQFDYITGLKDYSKEVKAVESSIGSINLI